MTTETEAREIFTAIESFQLKDNLALKAISDQNVLDAQNWYQGIEMRTPTNRTQALAKFQHIEGLLRANTNRVRRGVLSKKLDEANEKFKELKKLG